MPSKVFISYRRDDCKWAASAIHTALCETLSAENVFMDLDSISPGSSWTEALSTALDQCEVTFVLIGESWLDARHASSRNRRLDDPDDFVRMEISRSLERGIPVVPILIDDALLPPSRSLPDDISELLDRQGDTIVHRTYKSDVSRLVQRLGLRRRPEGFSSVAATGLGTVAGAVPARSSENSLRGQLGAFLKGFDQWSFSASRIAKWGAQQEGFSALGQFPTAVIRDELDAMVADGTAETRTSKKGGTLYRLSKKGAALFRDA